MRFHGFITVRTDSTRLPQKALTDLGNGKSLIQNVIDRAKKIRGLDGIVVCTTDRLVDDVLQTIADESGVLCFRGAAEDKLLRWHDAARTFDSDYIVAIDGDDPFFSVELMEAAIAQVQRYEPDFLQPPRNIVCGAITYTVRRAALEKVCEMKDSSDTEMMWVYFTDTGIFKVATLEVHDPIYINPDVRLTLDYPEDLEFFKTIIHRMGTMDNTTSLRDILEFLNKNPDVVEINFFRQNEFLANQKNKTSLKLR